MRGAFMRRTRIGMVLVFAAAAACSGSAAAHRAASQNKPGLPTLAQVMVINREIKDAIPVTFVSPPVVTLSPTVPVLTRASRQVWEYRQFTTTGNVDATAALNSAGND